MNIESIGKASTSPRTASSDGVTQAIRQSAPNKSSETPNNQTQAYSSVDLEEAVQRLSNFVSASQSEISFSIDDVSGVRVVKILDTQSKEVIRQIPSEEAVELARALDKLQGLLIKAKA
jgi:flagellar protein FlaG